MKRIASILFSISCLPGLAQTNHVLNPSFENYSNCPVSISQLYEATPWFNPTFGTPDYYNQCAGSSSPAYVPNNWDGYQNARTGVAYAGGLAYSNNSNGREYIEAPFFDSLIAGKRYYVEFYVSLSDSSVFAISDMSACITVASLGDGGADTLTCSPQITNTVILSDTMNWVRISGFFTAQGLEKYITIGNFKDDINTNVDTLSVPVPITGPAAYYYIDDVSVIDSLDVGINEPPSAIALNIYPNPSAGIFSINKQGEVSVYNTMGQLMDQSIVTGDRSSIDISSRPKGIYFVKVVSGDKVYTEKVVVQ